MNQISRETVEQRVVRLSHAGPVFGRSADHLVVSLRRAMGVPDRAEPEVEQEFTALRATLEEQFRPEFDRLYARLLTQYLGSAHSVVLNALEDASAQDYLAVAEQIGSDMEAFLRGLVADISAVLSRPA